VLETVSLSWYELGRRTWREALDDDVPGLAAQRSYYFFLALFPALLFLLARASFSSPCHWSWAGDDGHWAHFLLWTGRRSGLVWISPGAVAAAILWLFVSLLFKLYIANFTDYEGSYGTVGGVIVVLLWFYLSGIAILAGAELNAEIEHASPYGKAPGQKNTHGKLLIGRRAARAFREHQRAIESVLMESAATRTQGSHPATRPERTTTSPVALRTFRSTEHRATRQAELVRIAVNTIIAVGWMRLAWRSTRLFRRAAVGAVVIGTALALDTRRTRD